jgi:Lar family restriction alleviation protein
MDKKLKPCPFCGGEVEVDKLGDRDECFALTGVLCKNCGIYFTCRETKWIDCEYEILEEEKNVLLKAWNRRADDGRED